MAERLRAALRGEAVDRATIICPGGMMSMAVGEVMASCGAGWPEAHLSARAMADLALAMQRETGFENLAVPFCMTVEASLWGAEIDEGSLLIQPRVRRPILPDDGSGELPPASLENERVRAVVEAIEILRRERPDVPVIGNVAGPFSVLAELVDAMMLLRWTRRRPELAHRYLKPVTDGLIAYAERQIEAGAEVLCVSEPTATGDILGREAMRDIVLPHLARLCESVRRRGVPVIVHICGDVTRIVEELRRLPVEALSVDSMVNLAELARQENPWRVMGNLSPLLLETGSAERVAEAAERLVRAGVRLVAPACGVVPTTAVANLRAAAEAVRREDV
jgi:MtaA/CmuA family methyltransferase